MSEENMHHRTIGYEIAVILAFFAFLVRSPLQAAPAGKHLVLISVERAGGDFFRD